MRFVYDSIERSRPFITSRFVIIRLPVLIAVIFALNSLHLMGLDASEAA